MKKYKLNPVTLRGTTIDLDNWAFNSIIDKRLKTNVKGILIHEYWHPHESSGCYLSFLEYTITKTTQRSRASHYSFCTLEEAKSFYRKWVKHPTTKAITPPKRNYINTHLSHCCESKIMSYAEKRGVLKSGFDVELVQKIKNTFER